MAARLNVKTIGKPDIKYAGLLIEYIYSRICEEEKKKKHESDNEKLPKSLLLDYLINFVD